MTPAEAPLQGYMHIIRKLCRQNIYCKYFWGGSGTNPKIAAENWGWGLI